jgi:hypothetical protein
LVELGRYEEATTAEGELLARWHGPRICARSAATSTVPWRRWKRRPQRVRWRQKTRPM